MIKNNAAAAILFFNHDGNPVLIYTFLSLSLLIDRIKKYIKNAIIIGNRMAFPLTNRKPTPMRNTTE
jgi:hypothetical protein